MIADTDLHDAKERLSALHKSLHVDEAKKRVSALQQQSQDAHFWDDQASAQQTMQEFAELNERLSAYHEAQSIYENVVTAAELYALEPDEAFNTEVEQLMCELNAALDALELTTWFSGEFDAGDCIVTVTPGQGGDEAQDWCEMLFKMYLKYAERKGFKVTVLDTPPATPLGLDRAVFKVSGAHAYGLFKAERGVHRLVRISPTDAKKRRQTTFAGIEVLPVLPEEQAPTIDASDIRVDVYHASGPGGQGVNTTDSAVRITHLPTGIVVTCQNERSQIQNKAHAMMILSSKLYELQQQQRAEKLQDLRGPRKDISWGNQIRNYTLYPFQLIKDTRTGTETSNVDAVLQEGDLDPFIVSYLRMQH